MNKYLTLSLLLGSALTARLPLKKKNLTFEGLSDLKERLATVGYDKFSNSQDIVPIKDYSNT